VSFRTTWDKEEETSHKEASGKTKRLLLNTKEQKQTPGYRNSQRLRYEAVLLHGIETTTPRWEFTGEHHGSHVTSDPHDKRLPLRLKFFENKSRRAKCGADSYAHIHTHTYV